MLDLRASKEIILKPNKDGTHNLIVKYDVFESDGVTYSCEAECYYPKVNIKNLDLEALIDSNNEYGKVTTKV